MWYSARPSPTRVVQQVRPGPSAVAMFGTGDAQQGLDEHLASHQGHRSPTRRPRWSAIDEAMRIEATLLEDDSEDDARQQLQEQLKLQEQLQRRAEQLEEQEQSQEQEKSPEQQLQQHDAREADGWHDAADAAEVAHDAANVAAEAGPSRLAPSYSSVVMEHHERGLAVELETIPETPEVQQQEEDCVDSAVLDTGGSGGSGSGHHDAGSSRGEPVGKSRARGPSDEARSEDTLTLTIFPGSPVSVFERDEGGSTSESSRVTTTMQSLAAALHSVHALLFEPFQALNCGSPRRS